MLSFLFFLLAIFLIWPLIQLVFVLWRNGRAWRRFMQNGTSGSSYRTRNSYKRQEPKPERPKKKFGADVGEYVAFTEVETNSTTTKSDDTQTATVVEEQITDIKWEDL